MTVGPIFGSGFIAGWANLMIGALWQGSLMLLAVWGIIRLFPKIHPAIQCWLWRLAFIKFLIVFLWLKPVNLSFHMQIALWKLGWLLFYSHTTRHLTKMTQSIIKTALPLPNFLAGSGFWFLLWLAGLVFGMITLIYLWRRQRMLCNRCFPIQDPAVVHCYEELGRRNKFRKMPRLFTADQIHSPLLLGIIQPKIILPATMVTDFNPAELQLILAHELAHYKRGDLIWNWLPAITRSLFFFLPYIWRVEQRLIQNQEICCDRMAVQLTESSAASFGNILFRVSLRPGIKQRNGLNAYYGSQSLGLLQERLRALQSINPLQGYWMMIAICLLLALGTAGLIPWRFTPVFPLPINMWINYPAPDQFEISAHVNLPKNQIKATTLLIDDKQLPTTYHLNDVYFGYAKPHEDNFPRIGLHKVTVKALTATGTIVDHNWIYFQGAMSWGSYFLEDQTVLKIGPFFWIIHI